MRVLIVDDHELARAGLRLTLSTLSGVETVDDLSEGKGAADYVLNNSIDLVLLDLNLPDMSGLDVLIQILAVCEVTVILLTGERRPKDFVTAMQMGASAVVSKSDPVSEIDKAIQAATKGMNYLSPSAHQLLGDLQAPTVSLSPRQKAMLWYLSQGETNKAISYRLGISAPTVSFHLRELREKLGVSSNKKILNRARELGLLSSEID